MAFLFLGDMEMSAKSSTSFSPAESVKSASHLGQLTFAKIVEDFPNPTLSFGVQPWKFGVATIPHF